MGDRSTTAASCDAHRAPEGHRSLHRGATSPPVRTLGGALRLVAALALIAGSGWGCGGSAGPDPPARGGPAGTPVPGERVVDETRGTYRGVRFGDRRREVGRRFGARPCSEGGQIAPVGLNVFLTGGPPFNVYRSRSRRPDLACIYRYRELALKVDRVDGVIKFVVTDARARTARGIRVGDSADLVQDRYPGAACSAQRGDELDAALAVCSVPDGPEGGVARGLRLAFGLDPGGEAVRSIWVEVLSDEDIDRLRAVRGG